MPKKVKVITCSNAALTSLEGMPVATRTINLAGMTKLTDLTGLKCDFNNNDYHYISIIDCPSLTSLAGLPEEMTGRLMI